MQDQEPGRWDDVRIFLAAYRVLSLGMAASRLGVDTSTVSRRLAAFEDQLGVRLFERTREGLLRTRAAEQMFEAAEAMETAHARMSREASDVEASAEGTVRLTVDPGIAESFVVPALPRFRAAHPRIEIELDASPLPRDLGRREADLALRSTRITGADLVATKVSAATWIPVGSPALVGELGALSSWDAAPWIVWDHGMAGFGPAQWVAKHASKAAVPLRTSHFASQVAAAVAGLGLALLPAPYLRVRKLQRARSGKPLAASLEQLPSSELWVVGHRVLRDVPRVNALWSFLVEEMRSIDRGGRLGADAGA
jgi:DNA-binding transcriptional LysR family regulator